MPVWDSCTTSLAAWRAPVEPCHLGVGAGFVDEDETLRIKIDLSFEPLLTRSIYITAPLLGGVRCLFLSVIVLRWKKRQSDAMPADIPRRFNSSCNSASVISGFAVTASNQLRMGFDALRFAVTALAFRNDVANLLEATAPADRAGRADTKALGSLSAGHATVNRGAMRKSG
ncbi:hypothetical protein AOQ71_01785 [Bradyrhizobium manausense]|uniref:Uncharacterized protein n=1 Tax=Bradyrhizobium manausense TaxID=989370 RepID=A0A0R3ECP1_9BRAD|nr:hypothetical protein AOQ71_01785 [Bradyrhizobium manausense]